MKNKGGGGSLLYLPPGCLVAMPVGIYVGRERGLSLLFQVWSLSLFLLELGLVGGYFILPLPPLRKAANSNSRGCLVSASCKSQVKLSGVRSLRLPEHVCVFEVA